MKPDFNQLEKVVINVGLGRASALTNFEDRILPATVEELSAIVGQHPMPRAAKKSIAGFKLRAGTTVGLKVTLRRKKLEQFLRKLTNTALPRIRDFRGINDHAIDKKGILTMGIKEHVVFPEIIPENSKVNFGMEITVVPKKAIATHADAVAFYQSLGIPFKK
ncbi:MAG: 50S ribosomal protein L5 [Patescibacteria group bacterium]|nr:50S ribosomal protein L5 [Patescibacteria group bacterium]